MFVCCGLSHVKDNREEEVYVTLVTVCVCVEWVRLCRNMFICTTKLLKPPRKDLYSSTGFAYVSDG